MEVNGRFYTLWGQFVERQDEWIGGTLEGDGMDTEITGITLKPNGSHSAFFSVIGRDFSCGFDVQFGGIVPGEEGWLTVSGYGGHRWRFKKPVPETATP